MRYYCPKRHMYQMPSERAVRVSPCCHSNEVSVITSHTMDQYCEKKTKLTGFQKTKLSRHVRLAMAMGFP